MILHVDMDAFYASIEQRDNPRLRGKPVIVGGSPGKRGVVAAASYEARKFGLHAAMPLHQAVRLCPNGHYLPVRMTYYEKVSAQIMAILKEYSPLVESISLDEAFVDLSGTEKLFGPPEKTAKTIQDKIQQEVHLTASVGLASSKFMAKIASDLRKPNGFVVLKKEEEWTILKTLPISAVWGVGEKMGKSLKRFGIVTVGDLAAYPKEILIQNFGQVGDKIYALSKGLDDRPVIPFVLPKSCGNECTFEKDQSDLTVVQAMLLTLCEKVGYRLRRQGLKGKVVTLKVRLADFFTFTHGRSLDCPTDQAGAIYETAMQLFQQINLNGQAIRLIGVSVSNLTLDDSQLWLFREKEEKSERLYKAVDRLNEKYHNQIISRASIAPFAHQFPETIYK
jgi:DNA polymerase IV